MNMRVSSKATVTATDVSVALEESCYPVNTHTHTLVDLCTPNSSYLDRQPARLSFFQSQEKVFYQIPTNFLNINKEGQHKYT